VRFEAAGAARRMAGLKNDQDASPVIVARWTEMQQLHEQLADQTLDGLRQPLVRHLKSRASNCRRFKR
jgi:hypothetical protein